MLEQLRSYLKPPVFPGDEDKTFTAGLLHVILWSLLVGICLYMLTASFFALIQPHMRVITWLYVLILSSLTLVLMAVMRRGHVWAAAIAVNGGLWIVMTIAAYFSGGVIAPAYGGYLIVIICTCLLVSWRWGLVAAAVSTLAGGVFLLASNNHWLPDWPLNYGAIWGANVAYCFAGTMLLALALRAIKHASQQTRRAVIERQKTEEALSHSEQRFRAIFDAVNDAIFVQDIADGRFLDVNQKMCEMYGYTREEARQLIVGDLSAGQTPYTQQEALAWLKQAASGEPQIFEWQSKDRAGRLFWTEVNMRRATIDGQDRLLVVVRDVDERKRAEQQLHLKEESLRLALEAARMSTWDWLATTDQWSWSDNIEEIFGQQVIEPVGTFASFLNQVVEEDRQKVSDIVAQALAGQGDRFMLEHRVRWPDGSIHWLEDRGQVFRDAHGQPVRITGTIAEISDRKRMEIELAHERDLLQALMDNFPDTIYFKDTASRFTRINRAQATMLGVATPEEALGKTDADFFQNSKLTQMFLAEEQHLMTTGEPIIDRLECNPTPAGQPRWLTATKVPLQDAGGQIVGMVGISRDITDRVLAEQREKTMSQGLRAVIEATQELIDCVDLDILYRRSVELAREKLGLERCGLHLLDDQLRHLLGTFGTDDHGQTVDERTARTLVLDGSPLLSPTDRLWWVENAPQTYYQGDARQAVGQGWIAATPIRSRRHIIGMLYNDAAITHAPLDETQQEVVTVYASLLGNLIELKRTEAALAHERDLLQSLMDNIPDMIYFKDTTSRFTRINQAQARMLGIATPEEALGKTDADFFQNSKLTQMFLAEEQQLMTSGEPITDRVEYNPTPDGRSRWLSASKVPLRDAASQIVGLVGISRDITDRRLMEERLRESQARFGSAFEHAAVGMALVASDRSIMQVNRAFCQILGYEPAEVVGQQFSRLTHPDDVAISAEYHHRLFASEIETYEFETRYLHRQGQTVWAWLTVSVVRDAANRPLYAIAQIQDITERKRAEAQIERALRETRVRFEVSQVLAGKETEGEVLDALIQHAGLYPQAFVAIFTFDRKGDELVATLRHQNPYESGLTAAMPIGTDLPASQYTLFDLFSADQIFVSLDVRVDERFEPAGREVLGQTGAVSFAAIPLTVGNEWLGYIAAMAQSPGYFDEEKQHLYQTLAEQGAVALRAARWRETIRESQQRLSLLVQQSPLAVIEWNTDWQVVSWNPAAERIFGYTHEEALGRHATDFLTPEGAPPLFDQGWQAMLTQEGGVHGTYDHLTKGGRRITCEWFNAPLVGAAGQAISVASLVQDITERKQAEERERRTSQGLRAMIEAVDELMSCADLDTLYRCAVELAREKLEVERCGLFTLDEQGWLCGTYGTNPQRQTTDEHGAHFPPVNLEGFDAASDRLRILDEAEQTYWDATQQKIVGRGWIGATFIRARDQVVGVLYNDTAITHAPVDEAQQEVLAVYCSLLGSLIELKRAEAALQQSEALFRNLADNAPAFIAMSDAVGMPTYLNRIWQEFRGNLPAMPLDDWAEHIHPNDRHRYLHEFRSAVHAQRKFTIEYRLRRTDGQYRWLFDTVVPYYTADERFAGFIGIAIDITDRKNAEEALRRSEGRLRLLTDNMVDSISQIDARHRLVYVSPSAERVFGHALPDLLGHTLYDFVHPEDASRVHQQVLTAIELHTPSLRLEYRYRHAASHYLWVESEARLLYDERGDLTTAVFGSRDVTTRKHIEAEREELITELEQKNAELEQFTYTVSHDLKSPLITIRGFLGFLEKDAANGNHDRLRADIGRIIEATARMQRLLDELLELSRIGHMSSEPEEVAFGQIAREAVELVQGRLQVRNVQVDIADNLPTVYGDHTRLVEVVQNLVDNAIKFMGDQPAPHITIGTLDTERTGPPVFFVHDNGLGIEPEYQERIFGLFNKLDARSEGTGVGLALVKRIIEMHGGRIWVESAGLGHGSTFFFTLPRPTSTLHDS